MHIKTLIFGTVLIVVMLTIGAQSRATTKAPNTKTQRGNSKQPTNPTPSTTTKRPVVTRKTTRKTVTESPEDSTTRRVPKKPGSTTTLDPLSEMEHDEETTRPSTRRVTKNPNELRQSRRRTTTTTEAPSDTDESDHSDSTEGTSGERGTFRIDDLLNKGGNIMDLIEQGSEVDNQNSLEGSSRHAPSVGVAPTNSVEPATPAHNGETSQDISPESSESTEGQYY